MTKAYGYLNALGLVLNDGLPRVTWTIIDDDTNRTAHSRISLSYTLILFQVVRGIAISGILMGSAEKTAAPVQGERERASLAYVRYTSLSALSSAIEVSVSNCARALDHPEIPLVISIFKFIFNLILDVTIMSQFHTLLHKPSMVNQAITQMVCDFTSSAFGLWYFIRMIREFIKTSEGEKSRARSCYPSLKTLVTHGIWTFTESTLRNSIYLWLMNGLVAVMGPGNTTAWNTFNTIRSEILMVPLQTLEASTLTFVGHAWGEWRGRKSKKAKIRGKQPDIIAGLGPIHDPDFMDSHAEEDRTKKFYPKISDVDLAGKLH
jgi:Na+-driven multidrug efflux pump